MSKLLSISLLTIFLGQAFANEVTITVKNTTGDKDHEVFLVQSSTAINCAKRPSRYDQKAKITRFKSHTFVAEEIPNGEEGYLCVHLYPRVAYMSVKIDKNGQMTRTNCEVTDYTYNPGSCGEPTKTEKGWNIDYTTGSL